MSSVSPYLLGCLLTLFLSGCDGQLGIVGGEVSPTQSASDGDFPAFDATDAGIADADILAPDVPETPVLDTDIATKQRTDPLPLEEDARNPCDDAKETAVIALANQVREAAGLAPLACDPILTTIARDHAHAMCAQGFFSHTTPDGADLTDRLDAAQVPYWGAGENIAAGQPTPADVIRDWTQSPGHTANMLGQFTHIGVGYAPCANLFSHYWTQVFVQR